MYTAPITSWTMTMYTTCYGMILATMTLRLGSATILRFSYVGMAVVITWLDSIKELFEIDRKMLSEVKKVILVKEI